jgi:hypothetical protein
MQPDPVGARSTAVVEDPCDGGASAAAAAALSGEEEKERNLFQSISCTELIIRTSFRGKSGVTTRVIVFVVESVVQYHHNNLVKYQNTGLRKWDSCHNAVQPQANQKHASPTFKILVQKVIEASHEFLIKKHASRSAFKIPV